VPIEEANQEVLMQYMTKEKEEIYDISSL
jgi:hypothetical protein